MTAPSGAVVDAGEASAVAADAAVTMSTAAAAADSVPFEPTGRKLASIAWRTWVYADPEAKAARYGYLRAGAVVDRRDPPIFNSGCPGGWYRINPRGFVCVGKGATLDLEHPVVKASAVRPRLGQSLPYLYARSGGPPPYLYFRLPTAAEMTRVEGDYRKAAKQWRSKLEVHGLLALLGLENEPPPFLTGAKELEKPYGTEQPVRYFVHGGQASANSGFAVASSFNWAGRVFGLTTELDLIALDRTRVVKPSSLHGLVLADGEDLPVAVVKRQWVIPFVSSPSNGRLTTAARVPRRTFVRLTGKTRRFGDKYWETSDGRWLPDDGILVVPRRSNFPSVAGGARKWIDISIGQQTLVAYVGEQPVYVTLVSTGAGGLGDPEKTLATVRGTFMIYAKHVSETMDGNEDKGDSFNLRDVPFVQYFYKGYALHGTYWHDDFGRVRSHGCVNLAPQDAAWLFDWTDPSVPPGWHGVLNPERGTAVYIHP